MRLRHVTAVLVLALVTLAALAAAGWSGAGFSNVTATPVHATTDHIHNWLHAYSQATDPAKLTGYATRRGSSPLVPAATGQDETIAVHLGGFSTTGSVSITRVITIQAVSPFPESVSPITATAALVADPATGSQPITAVGFAAVGGTGRTNPITLTAGQKLQMNLRVRMRNLVAGTLYQPRVRVTVTWSGFTTTYYQYEFVVKAYYGSGAGPD